MSRPKLFDSIDVFHETAVTRTGLSDFGDTSYLVGLKILLQACDTESVLNDAMYQFTCEQVISALCGRLVAEKNLREYPAWQDYKIKKPIVIVGLPRSGTTALHRLVAADPKNQGLELWLAGHPLPRPPREEWDSHPVFKAYEGGYAALNESLDEVRANHESAPHLVDECSHMLFQEFTNPNVSGMVEALAFDRWAVQVDATASYKRHDKILRMIGSTEPEKRWVLKDPPTMPRLDVILNLYPDACIVHLHRDPTKCIPSICSLVSVMHRGFGGGDDQSFIYKQQMAWHVDSIRKAMAVRDANPQNFYDLPFKDFVGDPIATMRGVYDRFGIEMSAESEEALTQHASSNPKDKHGEHRYTAEQFGISEAELAAEFNEYFERFGQYF